MRRIHCLALVLATVVVSLVLGCGKQSSEAPAQNKNVAEPAPGAREVPGKQVVALATVAKRGELPPVWQPDNFAPPDADQDRYDAALAEAINLVSQKKYAEALITLQVAAKFKDTELVQAEIQKLRFRVEREQAAQLTLQDIQNVFDQGRIEEAGQLAGVAAKEFGGTEASPGLNKIKLQADALAVARLNDNGAKFKMFRDQGQAALDVGNLRGAAMGFEQALQFAEDAATRQRFEELRNKVAMYEDNRRRAAELRKDPANLEDAIALLQEAAKAWSTLQIRQEIDEYNLALQVRRDRIGVADFEVRGDVGFPWADRTLAEELLPNFKVRFDIVERSQIARVVEELKLEAGPLDSDLDQREVGRLARIRYLVLGSVTRIGGLTASARLVDVRSGLVVQTAKVTAATPEELLAQLPELAKLLMMSDQERIVYEQEQLRNAPAVPVVRVDQPLPPPPPEAVGVGQPLPPPLEIVDTRRPPNFGAVKVDDFQRLQPLPENQPLPAVVYGGAAEEVWKTKALYVSMALGDDLYRSGRPREAIRYFDFGLTLSPGNVGIDLRITRTRPLLPPPPVIIIAPPPPPPRIAIIDFVVVGNPAVVPPELSWWTPQYLTPYFSPPYQVVDRGELYWWMGRMGMTVNDLLMDPYARRWLGRALNIRYFVFGTITQTASFNVDTYMIDGEYGFLTGRGFVHARNPFELKYRLGELAQMTQNAPILLQKQKQQYADYEGLLGQIQVALDRGNVDIAIGFIRDGQKLRPRSVELEIYLQRANTIARQRVLEEQRRKDLERAQAQALAEKRRQEELARQVEKQRLLAVALSLEQRNQAEQQRLAANNQLLVQARAALKIGNATLSVQFFESALALRPNDDVYRELAVARADLDRTKNQRLAEEARLREAQLQRQKEEELVKARAKLEADNKARLEQEAAARKAQDSRDNLQYLKLVDQGEKQMANSKFNDAISTFQAARRLKKTDTVEALLSQAMSAQARADADAKGAAARAELERKLKEEQQLRAAAEADAKAKQAQYQQLLKAAQKALAERNYDAATANYESAGRVFKTDEVLTGLAKAKAARDQAQSEAAAAKEKLLAEQTKQARFQTLMSDGKTALLANDFAKAVDKFSSARNLIPDNVDALASLTKAEQARDKAAVEARNKTQGEERNKAFNRLLKDGQDSLARKQFDSAVANLTQALELKPGDAAAAAALKNAQQGQAAAVKTADQLAEAKKKSEAYQKAMNDGRLALQNKQFDTAIQAFDLAQKSLPGDLASQNLLKEARQQKDDTRAAEVAAAKKKADALQLQQDVQKALKDGRAALAAKKFDAANQALAAAAKLSPTDPAVAQLRNDLQKAQDAARADAEVQQKRKAQFDTLLSSGKKALDEKRFDAAVKTLTDANALAPGDPTVAALLKQALQARDAQGQASAKLQQLLQTADKALKARDLTVAANALNQARQLAPNDPTVQQLAQELDRAQAAATAGAADAAKKKAAFDQALKQGQDLLAAKNYDGAIKALQLAGTYQPGDPTVNGLLKQALQARDAQGQGSAKLQQLLQAADKALKARDLTAAANALNEARQLAPNDPSVQQLAQELDRAQAAATAGAADAAKKKAAFDQALKQGQDLLAAKNYDAAIKALQAANTLQPGDPKAAGLLKQAQQARTDAANAGAIQQKTAEYNKQMQAGAAFDSQQKWQEAMQAYDAALKQQPKDAKAAEAKNKSTYRLHMAEGNRLMAARQFQNAVPQFEAALRLYPKDADATAALKKAKEAK